MKYGSTGYVVVLNFMSGYSMGVTEVATSDDRRYFLSFIFVNSKNFHTKVVQNRKLKCLLCLPPFILMPQ